MGNGCGKGKAESSTECNNKSTKIISLCLISFVLSEKEGSAEFGKSLKRRRNRSLLSK